MDLNNKIEKIGIVFAMKGEALATIHHFNLERINGNYPVELYGNAENKIVVSLNGTCSFTGVDNVGTQAATLNTYVLINEVNPDIVINAGTAGGFAHSGAKIGDVYIGTNRVVYHDRRIPLPKFDEYGIGNYGLINTDYLAKQIGIKQGIISTGNSLDYVDRDLQLMKMSNASLKDMEAASVAWVCQLLNKTFIPIKSVTDMVDGGIPTEVEFKANFNLATKNLNLKLIQLIDFIYQKTMEEIVSPEK